MLRLKPKVERALNLIGHYGAVFLHSLSFLWESAAKETFFLIVALLVQGCIPAITVWLSKQVVDTVAIALNSGNTAGSHFLTTLVLLWVGAILVDSLLAPWIKATQSNLNEKLTAHLNVLLMRKAGSFPDLSQFEDPQFYDELKLIQEQASFQPFNLLTSLSAVGRQLFTVIPLLALLVPIGFWIPILLLVTTLPQALATLRMEEKALEIALGRSMQSRWMQYCTSVMLTDTYAKEVRLFHLQPFFIERYQKVFQELHKTLRRFRNRETFLSTGLALLDVVGITFTFYWVVQQAFRGNLSLGSILLVVQALAFIQQSIPQLVNYTGHCYQSLLYLERLLNFLEKKPELINHYPTVSTPKPIQSGITFNEVFFYYSDGRPALKNISFSLRPGETVALVGENGAGKSTIVKLLTRLYDPTAGVIKVDDRDLKSLDLESWRQQIAVVFQDFGHYSLTLHENIALGNLNLLDQLEPIKEAGRKAGLTELADSLPNGYHTLLSKQFGGTELSGGQWQKIALARSFTRGDSELLILDEPTAALDPRSEFEIYQKFVELAQNKITLIITHRLASVSMADRILVLKNGQIVEEGTHQSLLSNPIENMLLASDS
ncbi:ABC transporter ATP-binding protein [Leptolyngbya sp. 7M]|uniref:ABC transporter ATP-binding protein n=1 Tax=Leptolyngbya sp. 7M TaxID=2812896 RepID=UPI001B8CFBB8|nr:ABC transporter ATP-binding protein [Leptolyngbya sp. 7M]QYO63221.1 ABC transporter ATP-binding protein/permease [Leptolyngbya sp. 7M]